MMKEKMIKYVELVKELKALSEDFVDNYEEKLTDGLFDEFDIMSGHCDCCLKILKEEGVE